VYLILSFGEKAFRRKKTKKDFGGPPYGRWTTLTTSPELLAT
jgi:hypothetical protein